MGESLQPTVRGPRKNETAHRDAIISGSESAFESLLETFSPSMLRVARSIVLDRAAAEDVVQDTWVAVIKGLPRFQGRSSLKTWVFAILTNQARTRAKADRRARPMSSYCESEWETEQLSQAGEQFSVGRLSWMSRSTQSKSTPEDALLSQETLALVRDQLRSMPARQAAVVKMRDLERLSASEVCVSLGLSDSNQKVLLHRGRLRIRRAIELHRQQRFQPSRARRRPSPLEWCRDVTKRAPRRLSSENK